MIKIIKGYKIIIINKIFISKKKAVEFGWRANVITVNAPRQSFKLASA